MKKINLALISIMTLIFGVVLSACTFKKVDANFTQEEVVLSVGQDVDLEDCLEVKEASKSDIEFQFSNSTLFEIDGSTITAKKAGKSFVYATYDGNNLASMQVVVKNRFETPIDFSLSADGLLKWNAVVGYLENETTATKAESYLVEGTCKVYSAQDPTILVETKQINETVLTNSYELPYSGIYELTVTTKAAGYFDASAPSAVSKQYWGYTNAVTNLSWDTTGVLSWEDELNTSVSYRIKFNGVVFDEVMLPELMEAKDSKQIDLSDFFDAAPSGQHEVSVYVFDDNEKRIATESEVLTITKFEGPTVDHVFEAGEGSHFEISSQEGVEKYEIQLSNDKTTKVYTMEKTQAKISTILEGLESEVFDAEIRAVSESGLYYQSNFESIGKIYKLPATILVGDVYDAENRIMFDFSANVEDLLVDSILSVTIGERKTIITDFVPGNTYQLELSEAGSHNITVSLLAAAENNQISEQDVIVLNGESSQGKIEAFENEIIHEYSGGKSVLTFDKLENATNYVLMYNNGTDFVEVENVNNEMFEIDATGENVVLTFVNEIENLFDAVDSDGVLSFEFKIVARADDDKFVVDSYVTKKVDMLSAPTTANSGNSTDKTYSWTAADGADEYKIEVYEIDAATYNANKENPDFVTTTQPTVTANVSAAEYVFDKVGYYVVKVFAVSENENVAVSSKDCLQEMFYIAEQLQVGELGFGYDESYKAGSDFASASGYFVKLASSQNVDTYEVSVEEGATTNSTLFAVSTGEENLYLLAEDFADVGEEAKISVVAKSNVDSTLYQDSETRILTIERLLAATYDDLLVDNLAENITLQKSEGVSMISMIDSTYSSQVNTDADAVMSIVGKTKFNLKIKLFGSELSASEKLFAIENDKVYLDSPEVTLNFERLATPTNLKYYDGDITFVHSEASTVGLNGHYVLDILCKTAGGDTNKFEVFLTSDMNRTVVNFDRDSYQLTGENLGYAVSGTSNSTVSIDVHALIEAIKNDPILSGHYAQATEINFDVYGFIKKNDANKMLLSSLHAVLDGDETSSELAIEKIEKSELELSVAETNYVLSWQPVNVSDDESKNALTKYEIYAKSSSSFAKVAEVQAATVYNLNKATFNKATYYEYYIKATNPYCLESNNSNIVKFYLLQNIESVIVSSAGKLQPKIASGEQAFVENIAVSIDGAEAVELENDEIQVSVGGEYQFVLVGKTIRDVDETIYYINSDTATLTLTDISTIAASETISYTNNVLSWTEFAKDSGLTSLAYMLVFTDESGEVAIYETTQKSVDLDENVEIADILSALQAGDITVEVFACIKTYVAYAGQTVYYAAAQTVAYTEVYNAYKYTSSTTITKLTTPEITSVEFVYDNDESSDAYLTDANKPTIKVTFAGNFAVGDSYSVYINNSDQPSLTETIKTANEDSFEIAYETYNNGFAGGSIMKISIIVSRESALPSSMGMVEISRAVDVKSVSFEEDETISHNLGVEFDVTNSDYLNYLAGGIVLKIEINSSEFIYKAVEVSGITTENSKAIYDLSDIVADKLVSGGTIKVSAFINSYSNNTDNTYYLASTNMVSSDQETVLKSVGSQDITIQAGGFVIAPTLNNITTEYVVEYGEEKYTIKYEDGQFYFEIPNAWTNTSYDLTIYAKEANYIDSKKSNISYSLSRIDRISGVTIQRSSSDLSAVTMSWEAVSGATGYIIKVYTGSAQSVGEMLYSTQTASTSISMIELFGGKYENLGLNQYYFAEDYELYFEFITVGNSVQNNSYSYGFDARMAGNKLLASEKPVYVDTYGLIHFEATPGQAYLYRFVDTSVNRYQMCSWARVVADDSGSVVVDASTIDSATLPEDKVYELEVVVLGTATTSATSTSADFDFALDSLYFTTTGRDITFKLNPAIINIGYHESLSSSLAFTITKNSFTKIYAGLDPNDLKAGKVVEFVPEDADIYADSAQTQKIYGYSPLDLIGLFEADERFKDDLVYGDLTIYFWSYREIENVGASYTISRSYNTTFGFSDEIGFKEIKKMGKNDGTNSNYNGLSGFAQGYEDFANAFALFESTDRIFSFTPEVTIGMLVRVTLVENVDGKTYSRTAFVSREKLLDNQYFNSSTFAVNLTDLFNQAALENVAGKFKVEFSKIAFKDNMFYLFDWKSTDDEGKEFIFEKLAKVSLLKISAGNIEWFNTSEHAEKSYVYFAEDENLEGNYSYYVTDKMFFDASSYVGENDIYYIAVQNVSEDLYVLPSHLSFVKNQDGDKQVYKNQIKNKITLSDGKLSIAWSTTDDFYQTLMMDGDFATITETFLNTTFTAPFTFKVADLVNNRLKIMFKFTPTGLVSEGESQYISVNAKYLLGSFEEIGLMDAYNAAMRLQDLYEIAEGDDKATLYQLMGLLGAGSYGIANYNILFDDVFEKIQTGSYKVEYALLGSETALASRWYQFANTNNENVLYVNSEPEISTIKVSDANDKSKNSYKLLIKKSQVYSYSSETYSLIDAESYVLKMSAESDFVFNITKIGTNFSLALKDDENSRTVSVYHANASGEIVDGGDYLMFYLNHNDGDSILGKFGDDLGKLSYKMQIYAVGNDYSASSKSAFYNLILLGFGQNIKLSNGMFVWTVQRNRDTSVIYKKKIESGENIVTVGGGGINSTFALEDAKGVSLGSGLYEYIKFVMQGEVIGNSIYVDSEIFTVENVYKLDSPTLSSVLGEIYIDDSSNKEQLENSYLGEDEARFNYMIYNEVSTQNQYIQISSESETTSYQVGVTNIDEGSLDYAYKLTESTAKNFYVKSLGTTSSLYAKQSEESYYEYTLVCIDELADGEIQPKISIRSQAAVLKAQMMDAPTGLNVSNGMLKWDAVSTGATQTLTVTQTNTLKTVYKVGVVQYMMSPTQGGETETNVGETYYYYTANAEFDFALLEEAQLDQTVDGVSYLKVTVQAMALNVSTNNYFGSVRLVEGGYAYSSDAAPVYYDGTEIQVLKSNGASINQIDRLAPIDEGSLQVVDGALTWTYTTYKTIDGVEVSADTFFEKYNFVVTDGNGNQILGESQITAVSDNLDGDEDTENDTRTFSITFREEAGSMPVGSQVFSVYTTQGSANENVTIKSFARTITATKLAAMGNDGFGINMTEDNEEYLDLSEFFVDNETVFVDVTIVVNSNAENASTFRFTKETNKLYIFYSIPESVSYPAGFFQNRYFVIGENDTLTVTFKVKTNESDAAYIYSDFSEFIFQRTSMGDSAITWNSTAQRFEWQYNGNYTLKSSVDAIKMGRSAYLKEDAILYSDEFLEIESGEVLSVGEQLTIVEEGSTFTKIEVGELQYYIWPNSYEYQYAELSNEATTLNAGFLFEIREYLEDDMVIVWTGSEYYQFSSSYIQQPIYTVEVGYGTGTSQITRIYTTTETYFEPTIIGDVSIKIRAKLSEDNLQSQELVYAEGQTESFNLFGGGDGSSANPYTISTTDEFLNISFRMKKGDYLKSYVTSQTLIEDNETFHFVVLNDIDLGTINGIALSGEFEGVLSGKIDERTCATIKYNSVGVSSLTTPITVGDGNIVSSSTATSTTYRHGSALIESIAAGASVSFLNIDVTLAESVVDEDGTATHNALAITNNSLIAGLAVSNGGTISNINLINFDNNFYGYRSASERIMMVYSGIASINSGASALISNCKVMTDIQVGDYSRAQIIFVSGIVYTNYATVDGCVAGEEGNEIVVNCQVKDNAIQVAGIAITNTSTASIKNCVNNMAIQVAANTQVSTTVFMAQIACLGSGSLSNYETNGLLETVNIPTTGLYIGEVYATTKRPS